LNIVKAQKMGDLDTSQSRLTIFIILLILSIPSIACSLYIFYQFIKSRELRQRVNNHVILVLLIISFIQVRNNQLFFNAYID
jgi:hypothetical protein